MSDADDLKAAPSHDMHRVGDGRIWCCSVCGFNVELIAGDTPLERVCFGSFGRMIEWSHQSCNEWGQA